MASLRSRESTPQRSTAARDASSPLRREALICHSRLGARRVSPRQRWHWPACPPSCFREAPWPHRRTARARWPPETTGPSPGSRADSGSPSTSTEQLPVTASAPTLSGGRRSDLGPATESADGRSLSLVTTDPSVADRLHGDHRCLRGRGKSSRGTARHPGASSPAPAITPRTLPADPATPGPYHVSEASTTSATRRFRCSTSAASVASSRARSTCPGRPRREARRHLPARSPLLLLRTRRAPTRPRWPCRTTPDSTEQRWPIPSFLGYDAPARALASNGYAVVSVSANAINANDNQLAADYGAQARGELILDTLRMLKKANAGEKVVYHDAFTDRDVSLGAGTRRATSTPPTWSRRLDLGNVGIMGHSRGGEGVVRRLDLNDALPVAQQFGIKAVLPLAPVDYDRISLPNVATATILPYCDGDVENLMGQHIVDDSRHAFDDNVLRSAVLVDGRQPQLLQHHLDARRLALGHRRRLGPRWHGADDPVCDPASRDHHPAHPAGAGQGRHRVHRRASSGSRSADEKQFQPMFDGSDVIAPSTRRSPTSRWPRPSRRSPASTSTPSSAPAPPCALRRSHRRRLRQHGRHWRRDLPQTLPYCSTSLNQAAVPHWSPAQWALERPVLPDAAHDAGRRASGQVRVGVPRAAATSTTTSRSR